MKKMVSKELVIIGAGPAGLRAGEEAQARGIDYIILEKGKVAQAWKDIRPAMKLLSPCHPQRDWTSISPAFPIWKLDVSRPYCTAKEFVNYVDVYRQHFNLTISEDTQVKGITHDGEKFTVTDSGMTYEAPVVLIATGIFGNPYIPSISGVEDNPYVEHTHHYRGPETYSKKRVLIVGAGNSAAETAIELAGTAMTYMVTRGDLQFFSDTKKLYDIRGISESYLKELISMEIIRYKPYQEIKRIEENVVYFRDWKVEVDCIMFGTGYQPVLDVVKNFKLRYNKNMYPENSYSGESMQIPNLFFAGPLAFHSAASIVIHGFVKKVPATLDRITEVLRNGRASHSNS